MIQHPVVFIREDDETARYAESMKAYSMNKIDLITQIPNTDCCKAWNAPILSVSGNRKSLLP